MSYSGTGVSVEVVDHAYQSNMLAMLKETGRSEMVDGWYHSHPGFGCCLSDSDIKTQQRFEALNQRAVLAVVDPIQSGEEKVAIDAFRLTQTMKLTTSNPKPSIQALNHGLNIAINCHEEKMLHNLHEKKWTDDGLTLQCFDANFKTNEQAVEMLSLAVSYNEVVQEEDEEEDEHLEDTPPT